METIIDTRNRHFLNAARRIIDAIPRNRRVDLSAVAAKVASSPAPAYYCSFLYALKMLYVYRRGNIHLREGRRKDLWAELNAKVEDLLEFCGGSIAEALSLVLARGCASQFFISPVTATNLLRRYYDHRTRTVLVP